jgi:hypothetical protein
MLMGLKNLKDFLLKQTVATLYENPREKIVSFIAIAVIFTNRNL